MANQTGYIISAVTFTEIKMYNKHSAIKIIENVSFRCEMLSTIFKNESQTF